VSGLAISLGRSLAYLLTEDCSTSWSERPVSPQHTNQAVATLLC